MTNCTRCACGEPSITRLHVHFSYPRKQHEPEATDPWRVHGGGYHVFTCGEIGCEAEAFSVIREKILGDLIKLGAFLGPLTAEQLADVQLTVHAP